MRDREGSTWIAQTGVGIARMLGSGEWTNWTKSEGLLSRTITGVLRDQRGRVWMGTGAGLFWLDPDAPVTSHTTVHRFEPVGASEVTAMVIDDSDHIWAAIRSSSEDARLARIDPEKGSVQRLEADAPMGKKPRHDARLRSARPIAGDDASTASFAAAQPVKDGQRRQRISKALKPSVVSASQEYYDSAVGSDGAIWFTCNKGTAAVEERCLDIVHSAERIAIATSAPRDRRSHRRRLGQLLRVARHQQTADHRFCRWKPNTFEKDDTLGSNSTSTLNADRRGWIWHGGDKGLDVYRSGKWEHYDQHDGLIGNRIYPHAFFDDPDGTIWVGTNRGLSRGWVGLKPGSVAVRARRSHFVRFAGRRTSLVERETCVCIAPAEHGGYLFRRADIRTRIGSLVPLQTARAR